jgi:hypothetical protein
MLCLSLTIPLERCRPLPSPRFGRARQCGRPDALRTRQGEAGSHVCVPSSAPARPRRASALPNPTQGTHEARSVSDKRLLNLSGIPRPLRAARAHVKTGEERVAACQKRSFFRRRRTG